MGNKTAIAAAVFLLLLSARGYCGGRDVGIQPSGWILLTADAALSAAAAWTLVDRNTQAGEYNKLYAQINGTTDDNYWRLKYEKSKVDARNINVGLAFSAAGAALAYTALDLLWFHNAFPVEPVFDPANKGGGVKLKEVF